MKKIINILITISIVICTIIIIYSSFKITTWHLNNKENKKINDELQESITISKGEFKIDFDELKNKNEDVVAYLKVKNTNIEYIVVKGKNNNYYLNHNFNKEYNMSGWVFADYKNKFDGTDKNIIIYGHNIQDGSMFGTLHNILKKDWYENEENLKITLITNDGEQIYKVFSVYQIKDEDYYIKTEFAENEFQKFVENLKKRSIHNFNEDLKDTNTILTLSTCSASGKERVVLHAKKIQ